MNEEIKDELREVLMQVVITTLLSISSVLVQAAISKLKYGHVSNYPSSRTYHRKREPSYERDEYDDDDYYINFGDDD